MIRRATVVAVNDPENLGRIRVKFATSDPAFALSPWVWPCSPYAGNGNGFFFLPDIGNEVFVVRSEEGDWICLGSFWSGRHAKPTEGTAAVKIVRTTSGHEIKLDDSGDLTITGAGGGWVKIVGSEVHIDGTNAVVTKNCVCSFTGADHPQGSISVKAKGRI